MGWSVEDLRKDIVVVEAVRLGALTHDVELAHVCLPHLLNGVVERACLPLWMRCEEELSSQVRLSVTFVKGKEFCEGSGC